MRRPTSSTLLAAPLLLALVAPSAAAQCGADPFEPNDDCAGATALAPGVHLGLSCQGSLAPGGANPDHYRLTIAAGDQLEARALFAHQASRDLDLLLLDPSVPNCTGIGALLDRSSNGTGVERILWTNSGASPMDVVLAVVPGEATGGATTCTSYDLEVDVAPDPCLQSPTPDDAFEPNDVCTAATALSGSGAWTDLFLSLSAPDHYVVTVDPNEIVYVTAVDDHELPLLSLDLYSDPTCGALVDASFAARRNEVVWVNRNAAPVDVSVRVASQSNHLCGRYDMEVVVTPDPCLAPQDDPYAPNGTCASGAVLTPGSYSGLLVDYPKADYFKITVPGTDVLTVDLEAIAGVNGDLGLRLYEDSSCQTLIAQSAWQTPQSVTTGASAGVTRDFYVNVYALGFPTDCNEYELHVSLVQDPCVTAIDDPLEDNDACTSPIVMAPGLYTQMFAGLGDEDFFRITVPPNDRITAQISHPDATGARLGVTLRDDQTCQTVLDAGGSSDGALAEWSNMGASPVNVVLCVEVFGTERGGCNSYDLLVDVSPDPCLTTADDAFEPNDDCATAATIIEGTHPDLYVHKSDADYYLVHLAFGDQFQAHVTYGSLDTDVRMRLYPQIPATGSCGDGSSYVAQSFGPNGSRSLEWTNDQPTGQFLLEVAVSTFSNGDCAIYDLTLFDDGVPTATPFCFGDGTADAGSGPMVCPCGNDSDLGDEEGCENSTGVGAKLVAFGSNSVALDDMVLRIDQARPHQPSLLIQGTTAIAVPFRDGILCMGNPTERIEIVGLDATGTGVTTSSIVTEGFIVAGDTRYYQQWYRDPQVSPCGSGSNFTHALRVDWAP